MCKIGERREGASLFLRVGFEIPPKKKEHAMIELIELYDVSAEEAMEVWQNIGGESAAWGEYREFANRSLKYWIEES
ncbi:MAG: hypothetical protein ACPL7O_04300, partial [Armatimonadota bacterium]